jgi:hypothetical protein
MRFTHHPRHLPAEIPWRFNATLTYDQPDDYRPGPKPNGFWLSVDDDWRRWCEAEQHATETLRHSVEFAVDLSRCIVLSDEFDIDEFHGKFCARSRVTYPDWRGVAGEYAGIVIAPYVWERRLYGAASSWYYGWDVASACVWDLSAVTPAQVLEAVSD